MKAILLERKMNMTNGLGAPNGREERIYFGEVDDFLPAARQEHYGHELEREEAMDLIRDEAKFGRTKRAWQYARQAIQAHFENMPDNGDHLALRVYEYDPSVDMSEERWNSWRNWAVEERQAAFSEWKTELRELLVLRRDIHLIAAKAERRRTFCENYKAREFNKFLGEE
jgi:hypothetical protein